MSVDKRLYIEYDFYDRSTTYTVTTLKRIRSNEPLTLQQTAASAVTLAKSESVSEIHMPGQGLYAALADAIRELAQDDGISVIMHYDGRR
jgi:hypothetical protein